MLHYISLSFHSAGKLLTSFLHTKKGDRLLPNNYRPLCCKALEHIISSNIYSHLPQVKIFCDVQHGFRERRSCKSQLIVTIDDFMKYLNSKGLIHAIFLDFKKAFDKVPHKKLCDKLATYYGIQGTTLFYSILFYYSFTVSSTEGLQQHVLQP